MKTFEWLESVVDWPSLQRNEKEFPQTQRTNSSGFEHFFKRNKGQICTSLLSKFSIFEMYLWRHAWFNEIAEKTFAKQYLFGCFSSNNSDLVCFAVSYKSTKSSRHGKNFPHDISIISLSSECSGTLCFSLIIIIIMMILSC